MTEAIYHGDLNIAKATQVDDKEAFVRLLRRRIMTCDDSNGDG
jgi:hypothetical protein